jgi:putative ABC transport system permease protein
VSGIVTNLWGAIVEAWTELRIHRTRVLLSLIGVAVAVTALSSVVALGQIVQQSQTEQNERQSGRPALLYVGAYTMDGSLVDIDALDTAYHDVVDRYSITYSSRTAYLNARVQLPGAGVVDVQGQAIDASFGTMHRVKLLEGRWFAEADNDRLAPAVIINEYYWKQLGSPDLASHPTTVLLGENDVTAVIIGVTPSSIWETYPSMFMLYSAYHRTVSPTVQTVQPPTYELWVPPELSEQLVPLVKRDIGGALGDQYQLDVMRNDYGAHISPGEDPYLTLKLMVGGGAALVLLLGALGLVNISLVTVRQRIREIGIRRSFGATAGRVFFAVMMESIVATFVAGVVGVIVAILLVQSPLVQEQLGQGVVDLPPFPLEAALLGIIASVVVGAIAGLLPALVAVRVKVIDAIRY